MTPAQRVVERLAGDAIRHVDVHDPRTYGRVLRQGSIGLGESYADGWWDADDLTAFLRACHRRSARLHPALDPLHRALTPLLDPIARLRRPDPRRDADNVRAHYDLSNEMFERILDETMAYSCAVFEHPGMSLATASTAKLDHLARMLDLSADDHVLEIGTGWGSFALHAARRYGCRITTTTISERQVDFARRRVRCAGLEDRVEVLGVDYRDLQGTYDKAIAVEMIEAVDWRDYDEFFASCRARLRDHGLLVLQAIVIGDGAFDRAKRRTDFIKAAIFPGGCLPSLGALTDAARRHAGLRLVRLGDIGAHYPETLRRWRTNLFEQRHALARFGIDERFVRLWSFYFSYCEAAFEERYLTDVQVAFAPPVGPEAPRTPSGTSPRPAWLAPARVRRQGLRHALSRPAEHD
jgi:cyclopropane-fatty-acyl-phospholipid synthase